MPLYMYTKCLVDDMKDSACYEIRDGSGLKQIYYTAIYSGTGVYFKLKKGNLSERLSDMIGGFERIIVQKLWT